MWQKGVKKFVTHKFFNLNLGQTQTTPCHFGVNKIQQEKKTDDNQGSLTQSY